MKGDSMEKSYNECYICGTVLNEPEHYLTINGEDFFRTLVSVKRKSGAVDVVCECCSVILYECFA